MLVGRGKSIFPHSLAEFATYVSREFFVPPSSGAKVSAMESAISHVKRVRLLSWNQIREIVMDSDSDEKYYISEDTEDDEPRPPSRRSSISEPPTPDFSASSSEDEDDVGNVAVQQPQPCLWTLPLQP